jgi:tetratricopeptide (TPR) repeat protein
MPATFGDSFIGVMPALAEIKNWKEYEGEFYDIKLDKDEYVFIGFQSDTKAYLTMYRLPELDSPRNKWKLATGDIYKPGAVAVMPLSATRGPGTYRLEMIPDRNAAPAPYRIGFFRGTLSAGLTKAKRSGISDQQVAAALAKPALVKDAATIAARKSGGFVATADLPEIYTAPLDPAGQAYVASKLAALRPFFGALYADGEHNAVANFERLAMAAIDAGAYGDAEWALDQALARIEAIYAKNSLAEQARSKWGGEAIKDFKGEPYERAMAYYYRGLLYLRSGDYENARAAFLSADYQDSVSDKEAYQSDFSAMPYLAGWSAQCLGQAGAAADFYGSARTHESALPVPQPGDNMLLIADLGQGPVKIRRGSDLQTLGFEAPRRGGADEGAMAHLDTGPIPLHQASSIAYQATTRGGRPIDGILAGNANFKNRTERLGTALSQSAANSGNLLVAAVGLVFMAAGHGASSQTMTLADVRMWDTLPDHISLATARLNDAGQVRLATTDGAPLAATMIARNGRCGIAWGRSRTALNVPAGVPGTEKLLLEKRLRDPTAAAADDAFRKSLRAQEVSDRK